MPPGRPSKLTRELLDDLEKTAASYWSIGDACANAGIVESTWHSWKAQGQADTDADKETLFTEFLALAQRVGAPRRRSICAGVLQQIVLDKNASDADRAKAALGLLRLDSPKSLEISGPGGGGVQLDTDKVTEALKAYNDVIERLAGGG